MKLICTQCGHFGRPINKDRGSFLIALILFCMFIIPWIIYLAWKSGTKYQVCEKCGSSALVPFDSPNGQKLFSENYKMCQCNKANLKAAKRGKRFKHADLGNIL